MIPYVSVKDGRLEVYGLADEKPVGTYRLDEVEALRAKLIELDSELLSGVHCSSELDRPENEAFARLLDRALGLEGAV